MFEKIDHPKAAIAAWAVAQTVLFHQAFPVPEGGVEAEIATLSDLADGGA